MVDKRKNGFPLYFDNIFTINFTSMNGMGGAKIWVKESWLRFSSDNFLQPVQPTTCQPSKVISKEIWFTKSEKYGLQNQRNMVYRH